jgi:hypothetical protein
MTRSKFMPLSKNGINRDKNGNKAPSNKYNKIYPQHCSGKINFLLIVNFICVRRSGGFGKNYLSGQEHAGFKFNLDRCCFWFNCKRVGYRKLPPDFK